jgi:hypothetical protein
MQTTVRPIHLPDAPIPEATKGVVREAYEAIRDRAINGAREVSGAIFPMTTGSKEAFSTRSSDVGSKPSF